MTATISPNSLSRFDHSEYVSMTMEFRCNLKCVHCMIEGTMDWLQPESNDRFDELLETNAREHNWKGLILTGSEITLLRNLPDLAAKARRAGFDHVRIQTHGMHLENQDYCRELVEAGVNEFFISVAGADADSHDAITQVPGSFNKTLQGLENLEQFENIISITNSVVTTESYQLLPALVERLRHLKRLVQMEFWIYFPMRETDEKMLGVRHIDLLPYLKNAIADLRRDGRGVEIKNFPECLLGEDSGALMNAQPMLFIDPAFWPEFERNGFYQCVHRDACGSEQCLGLNSAYIETYGWESEHLHPLPAKMEKEGATKSRPNLQTTPR